MTKNKNTLRLISINSFLLSFISTIGFIYAGSVFITSLGGSIWPKISLYCQVISIFLFFVFFWIKAEKIYSGMILLLLTLSAAIICVTATQQAPWAALLLGVAMLVAKIQTGAIFSTLLSNLFGPHIIQEVYQRSIRFEIAGRLFASMLGALTGTLKLTHQLHLIILATIIITCLYFKKLSDVAKQENEFQAPSPSAEVTKKKLLIDALQYLIETPLAKATLLLMTWVYSSRFFIETLHYQAIDHIFSGIDETTSVLSYLNVISMTITLFIQFWTKKYLIAKKTPSTLFSILPTGILLLSSSFLVTSNFWFFVAQIVFFEIINKTIQAPSTNQCLASISTDFRQRVYLLISVIISFVVIFVSGLLDSFTPLTQPDTLSIVLIGSCVIVFFVIVRFDSFYLGGLWQQYLNFINHKDIEFSKAEQTFYPSPTQLVNIKPEASELNGTENASIDLNQGELKQIVESSLSYKEKLSKIVTLYQQTTDRSQLDNLVQEHARLLESQKLEEYELAIGALCSIGFEDYALAILSKDPSLRARKLEALIIWLRHNYMTKISAAVQLKLRILFMSTFQMEDADFSITRLKEVFSIRKKVAREAIINILWDEFAANMNNEVIASIIGGREGVDFLFLVDCFMKRPFGESKKFRKMMIHLRVSVFPYDKLKKKIGELARGLSSEKELFRLQNSSKLEHFLKVLFLIEWIESDKKHVNPILYSFDEVHSLTGTSLKLWAHLHEEFLKGTTFADLCPALQE